MGTNHSMVEQSGYPCMGYSRFLQIQTSTCLVVPAWSTQSIYGLTGAMLAAVIASVSYECIDEYLRFLRRKALTRRNGTECCGAPVVTCGEKLGQSIIQVLRVSFAYFMIVCVMTMNVWLLVAVVVGAAVGYGVGKPLLANSIDDSVTSHGYTTASLKLSSRRNNRSERSKSWRYQQVHRPELNVQKRSIEDDGAFTEDLEDLNYSDNTNNGADVVWIRRSTEDLRPNTRDLHDVFDDPDAQIRTPDDSYNFDSIRSEGRESSRSDSNRFRSTSKIINDSFRSYKSDSEMRKYSTSTSTSANVSFDSQTLDSIENRKRSKRSANKVSRNASTASGGRFKPVSREINRQMSFNDDLR